jgi:hypothetical protein
MNAKETYYECKRDLLLRLSTLRYTSVSKETSSIVERDLI